METPDILRKTLDLNRRTPVVPLDAKVMAPMPSRPPGLKVRRSLQPIPLSPTAKPETSQIPAIAGGPSMMSAEGPGPKMGGLGHLSARIEVIAAAPLSIIGADQEPEPNTVAERTTAAKYVEAVIEVEPAGVMRRAVGGIVDAFVWGTIAVGTLALAGKLILPAGTDWMNALGRVALPALGLCFVIALAYTAVVALVLDARTFGARAMGLHLLTPAGVPPSVGRACARRLLSLVSLATFLGGYWLAIFDRHGQTLHDKLTSTFVIRKRA